MIGIAGRTRCDLGVTEGDVDQGEDLVDCNYPSTVAVAGAARRRVGVAVRDGVLVSVAVAVGVGLAVSVGIGAGGAPQLSTKSPAADILQFPVTAMWYTAPTVGWNVTAVTVSMPSTGVSASMLAPVYTATASLTSLPSVSNVVGTPADACQTYQTERLGSQPE